MFIVDAKRTPIGKFMGSLSSFSAPELTAPLFHYFLAKYPFLKTHTDEVILGNVLSAGIGMNPARIAAIDGGISNKVPAYTINQVCASGMRSIIQGVQAVQCNDAEIVLAGGMESMSQAPYILKDARKGMNFGSKTLIDSLESDGLYCSLSQLRMGETAELLATMYSVDRSAQDRLALASHQKAILARQQKHAQDDIISVGGLTYDEGPRENTSLSKLRALQPVFNSHGSITAGNSSSLADGAALLFLASQRAVNKHALTSIAVVRGHASVGLAPQHMGMGAQLAIEKLLRKYKLTIEDIGVFEINEAFAAQTISVIKKLGIPPKKINIYGGAIALGHPLAMSGTRIIMNAITALKQTKGKFAIASTCVGGGQGVAVLIENI